MKAEFSREVAVDAIGTDGRDIEVKASADECRALAVRFGWVRVERLEAKIHLSLCAGGVEATGRLGANLEQACASTGEPLPEAVNADFTVRFVESALLGAGQEEIELADDDLDVIEYEGGTVDVGEAVAQTLALSVNPYPRASAVAAADGDRIVFEDVEPSPFGALKGLFKP